MKEFDRDALQHRTLHEFRAPKPSVPTAVPDYEDTDEEDDNNNGSLFAKFRLIAPVIIIAIVCFVAYSWYTDKFTISRSNADIPYIKASPEELRAKPDDPGGMRIINRDKRVYDTISGSEAAPESQVERILPAPEKPIARTTITKQSPEEVLPPAKTNNDTAVTNSPVEKNKTPEAHDTPKATAQTQTDKAPDPSAINTKAPVEEKQVTLPPKQEKPPAPIAKEVTTADITDVQIKKNVVEPAQQKMPKGYRIQLGSYRSMGDTEISWKAVRKKFPDITSGTDYYVEKANLGAKGMFYRLQLAGFSSEADARKVCQEFIKKKQECFFVGK